MGTSPPLLLLVDDMPASRYAKARILRQAGFEVLEAGNGAEALAVLGTRRPVLVVLDVNLPDMSGFEICRRIKADPGTAAVLVLQVSATYVQPSDTARALEGGADACLTEPIEPVVLIATVRALLRAREAEQARDELTERLEAEHRLLTAVLQQMPAGVVVADAPSGRVLFSNDRAGELDIAGGTTDTAGRPYTAERSPLTRALRDGAIVAGEEIELTRPDGSSRVLHASSAPVRDRRGRTIAAVAVTYDVTDRKRAEQERIELLARERAAREDAEAANRAKDEFLAVLSHELRAPLNALLTWTTLLKSGQLDEATEQRALDALERNTRLQAKLIADLLDISRIITGKLALDARPLRLAQIVDACVEAIRPAAAAKTITLRTTLDPGVAVVGDPGRLQQVVTNLVSNAVKFTPAGGQIDIALSARDGHAEMSVSDTGAGIDPGFLPYVFDRFRQGDASTTRTSGGLGLGLAIVRHLTELHGGRAAVESAGRGRGARFTITLPLAAAGVSASTTSEPTTADTAVATTTLDGVSVLVLDDHADTRDSSATVLEHAGAKVRAVGSVTDALEALRAWSPDVVVSDIAMPERDGFDFVRELRAAGARIPALALTAYAAENDRGRILGAGYDLYLAKPADPLELIAAVARLAPRRTPAAATPAADER